MSTRPGSNQLTCTLDRWHNGRAVLVFSDGQELIVSKRFLPSKVTEGALLSLSILTEEMATKAQEEQARLILKEILNG